MRVLYEAARSIAARLAGRPRYAYLGDSTALVIARRGRRMLIDTNDRGVGLHLVMDGYWEPHVEQALLKLIRPGHRIVEVGANFGYHTVAMARAVGPTGRIDAFEPNPRMHDLLIDNIRINAEGGVVAAHRRAALDRAGPVQFQAEARYVGGGNVVIPGYENPRGQQFEVEAVRLDDVLADGPPVDLLRMDAEGSEPLVLRGAESLLRRSPQMRIVMEFTPVMIAARVDLPAFVGWLAAFGFRSWGIRARGRLEAIAIADLPNASPCDIVLSRDIPPGAR